MCTASAANAVAVAATAAATAVTALNALANAVFRARQCTSNIRQLL